MLSTASAPGSHTMIPPADLLPQDRSNLKNFDSTTEALAKHPLRHQLPTQGPPMVPRGTYVSASAPARIDLAGGWTDTTPITHEHGGKVVNVAVKINDRAPYTVKARRTEALVLSLSYDPDIPPEHFHSLDQIRDHADPLVPGALLKACIVASGILGITPKRHDDVPFKTIAEALKHSGGGLELVIRSTLPLGSGMGTSSILAAVILAVLKTLKGEAYTMDDLIYLTLDVEQMMNTGGGWQDQVGGILPGFKVSTCERGLPIQIKTNVIDLSDSFIKNFDSRLLLIYTGQTRLAKNLLQTVLMNWAGQEPVVVETMHRLVQEASQCERALIEGNMQDVGEVMKRYFAHKCLLSNTSLEDPPVVKLLLKHFDPYIEGASLAGAGGGGFLAVLLKPDLDRDSVLATVKNALANETYHRYHADDINVKDDLMWAWEATVDTTGLVVQIGEP
ncbi:ribosomal protein S5 domain 2-type protein [Gamsiella multidivaricata]|uniref:ribosomal protein S5 domain 2-type protein n=1 Tax=Gamsiella multidivaricata TaxID=101098 RepID=UPI00221F2FEA|nr:ribosomal protein S5 domain 2-type protein [Gamsiella multidivaricata]KAI7829414.1 ribosomal protein S5 domain 2-type protein [Gamsiella multidivaricata]